MQGLDMLYSEQNYPVPTTLELLQLQTLGPLPPKALTSSGIQVSCNQRLFEKGWARVQSALLAVPQSPTPLIPASCGVRMGSS